MKNIVRDFYDYDDNYSSNYSNKEKINKQKHKWN